MTFTGKVSFLDLTLYGGSCGRYDAIRRSLSLASTAEKSGLSRYWVVEHHGVTGIASATPAVLLAALSQATERIRLGTGGMLLRNYSPLVVAEQISMLSALAPGRIDVGLGRGRGASGLELEALGEESIGFEEKAGHLVELFGSEKHSIFDGTGAAFPIAKQLPIFILGSSIGSAIWAAQRGFWFAYARHLNLSDEEAAAKAYRSEFVPNRGGAHPYFILSAQACLRDNRDEAREAAIFAKVKAIRASVAHDAGLVLSREALEYEVVSDLERRAAESVILTSGTIIGDFDAIERDVVGVLSNGLVDELMVCEVGAETKGQRSTIEIISKFV